MTSHVQKQKETRFTSLLGKTHQNESKKYLHLNIIEQ